MRMILILVLGFWGGLAWGQGIINVNNTGNGVQPYFTNLQAGVDAASDGDIIYLYPSILSYGDATIDKKVTILGHGYSISSNPSLGIETVINDVIVGNISLNANSDSSLVMGCRISNVTLNDSDYSTIKNNRITTRMKCTDTDSLRIQQNYYSGGNLGTSGIDNDFNLTILNCSHIEVSNNLFNSANISNASSSTSSNSYDNLYLDINSYGLIYNNVFLDRALVNGATVFNNIFLATWNPLSIANSSVVNNVFSYNATLYSTENLINQGTSGICVGYPTQLSHSFDDRYQLAVGSPALGYGLTGDDCGVFTQMNPYKLSGIPSIPILYEFNDSTQVVNNGQLQLTLKARKEN